MKTFLLILFLPLLSLAQTGEPTVNDLRDRAFQMAKATVEFLATDTKTYGNQTQTTCPDCVSYPALKAFVQQQKLTKADELVSDTEKWVNDPATSAKDPAIALVELRTQLINRVTVGNERQHRRDLPSFAAYEVQMNQLAGQTDQSALAVNTNQPQTDNSQSDQDVQPEADTNESEPVAPLSQTQSAENSWLSKSGLALILSLLGLGLSGFLLATRNNRTGAKKSAGLDPETDKAVARLNDELFRLKGDRNTALDANQKLQKRVEQLEAQVAVLQKAVGVGMTSAVPTQPVNPLPVQPQAPASAPAGAENRPRAQSQSRTDAPAPSANSSSQQTAVPQTNTNPAPPAPVAKAQSAGRTGGDAASRTPSSQSSGRAEGDAASRTPKLLYARTVDLGDGFSAESLSETTSERPMIYQIQVQSPNQATFRVADDPYAQRLALSDPYSYLNDACEYNSQPASNSRIQTTRPGRLALQGNKWVIQEKAQIAFG